MADKLRLCPFCNGEALLLEYENLKTHKIKHIVRCLDCYTKTGDKLTEAEAIAAWNTRLKEENTLTLQEIRAVVNLITARFICGDEVKIQLMQEFEKARG